MYDIGCKLICLLTIICPAACEEGPGLCANLLTMASVLLILVTFPLSLLFTVKVVQEYERAVIFRLGRLLSGGASGPGVFFVIPCMDIYVKIDMRTATYEIPPQEILTKDSVTVFVNAIMYYKVKPASSVLQVEIFLQYKLYNTMSKNYSSMSYKFIVLKKYFNILILS